MVREVSWFRVGVTKGGRKRTAIVALVRRENILYEFCTSIPEEFDGCVFDCCALQLWLLVE